MCLEIIYLHRRCFIVSQLFSVARHVGRLKLGSEPTQLYVRLSIIPFSQQMHHISSGIISHYVLAFVCLYFALPDTRVLNSFEELCIMRVAAVNSFARVLNYRLALNNLQWFISCKTKPDSLAIRLYRPSILAGLLDGIKCMLSQCKSLLVTK